MDLARIKFIYKSGWTGYEMGGLMAPDVNDTSVYPTWFAERVAEKRRREWADKSGCQVIVEAVDGFSARDKAIGNAEYWKQRLSPTCVCGHDWAHHTGAGRGLCRVCDCQGFDSTRKE